MSIEIRPQYHFRKTDTGLDAWNVKRLTELSSSLPTRKIDPNSIPELHTNHWYMEEGSVPSPSSVIEHFKLINDCDLSYPIILDANGRVMDGMHRICKAIINNIREIDAVQFKTDPDPDYVDCIPSQLPYDA